MLMLTTWMLKSVVNGTHELLTPETLCWQALHRNHGMTAGQKLLETEQMERRGAGLVQTTSLVLMAGVASMATMASTASMATMLPAVTALLAPKLDTGILPSLKPLTQEPKSSRKLFDQGVRPQSRHGLTCENKGTRPRWMSVPVNVLFMNSVRPRRDEYSFQRSIHMNSVRPRLDECPVKRSVHELGLPLDF